MLNQQEMIGVRKLYLFYTKAVKKRGNPQDSRPTDLSLGGKNTSGLARLHLSQPASEHIHCRADALLLSKKRPVCKGHVCLYDSTASCALGQKH